MWEESSENEPTQVERSDIFARINIPYYSGKKMFLCLARWYVYVCIYGYCDDNQHIVVWFMIDIGRSSGLGGGVLELSLNGRPPVYSAALICLF